MAFRTLELTREDLLSQVKDISIKEIDMLCFKDLSFDEFDKADMILFNEDHDGVWDKDMQQLYNNPKMTKILKPCWIKKG